MIVARGLRRQFGSVLAVEDVSITVPDGSILALLGPNGAGKTTTVRLLAGLVAPSGGHATVAGCDLLSDPAGVRARVGLVTDVPGLHDQMSPLAYLDFFGRVYGLDVRARQRRAEELLRLFDVWDVRHSRMAGFSRGMQQKIALARALLHDPQVIFLDEPTAGLDPVVARTVRDLILRLKHSSRSIVLCTHDLDEAERLADTVAIMAYGRVVADDTPTGLRASASRETHVQVHLTAGCDVALAVAQTVPGVIDAALTSGMHGKALEYRTRDPDRTNPSVIAALVQVGAAIVSVTCTRASLEDAFTRALSNGAAGSAQTTR